MCAISLSRAHIIEMVVASCSPGTPGPGSSSASQSSTSSSLMESRIVKKPNTTSPIWKYFGVEADDSGKPINTDQVICRVCDTVVRTNGGSTTNLFSHLKKHHQLKYSKTYGCASKLSNKSPSLAQPTIQEALTKSVKYQKHSRKWKELTDSITYCVRKDMLPIYTVEKNGFRDMLKSFDPRYELPSRKYFSQVAIPALYVATTDKVKQELAEVANFWKKKRELRLAQQLLSLPEHSLVGDCSTRWGSTFFMIEQVLEQKEALRCVLLQDPKMKHLCFTWQDIDVLESLAAFMSPLFDFTDSLCGEQLVTVSTIKPVLCILKNDILSECNDDTEHTSTCKARVLEYVTTKKKLGTWLKRAQDKLSQSSDSTVENDESSVATIISKESESYKKVLRPDADSNPLDWWQHHSLSYPVTSQLAEKYLSICASSASSERVFSTSGHIVSKE
uniref:BED-type domain-containing protein n=1 Tax=Amphimedon queenslandica TaxID=400682 RepID=A0A1X7V255_AMPQE